MHIDKFKVSATYLIFRLVNFLPFFFPRWLIERAEHYGKDSNYWIVRKKYVSASLFDGEITWKAVSVVIRLDHQEVDLIYQWMNDKKNTFRSLRFRRDDDYPPADYLSLGGFKPIGCFSFEETFSSNLGISEYIDFPTTNCKSCYITLEKLPNAITYLSLYFMLNDAATTSISNVCVNNIKPSVEFLSLNPFSRDFKALKTFPQEEQIRKFISHQANLVVADVRRITNYFLGFWDIHNKNDELVIVADFVRNDRKTPYFYKSGDLHWSEASSEEEAPVDNRQKDYVFFLRKSVFYNSNLISDETENYCPLYGKDRKIFDFDAFFIKTLLLESDGNEKEFSQEALDISESHLYFSLHQNCWKQHKNIAKNANQVLLHSNSVDLEVGYNILLESIKRIDNLEENIAAIREHIVDSKYKKGSCDLIKNLEKDLKGLRSAIEKRKNNSNVLIQLAHIKAHRFYSRVIIFMVVIQIALAFSANFWNDIGDCFYKIYAIIFRP